MKNHFRFVPGLWLGNRALRACSPAARGFWMDLLCLCYPSGYLTLPTGAPLSDDQISRMVGEPVKLVRTWIKELGDAGIFDISQDGKLCSSRMVKEANFAARAKVAGEKGQQIKKAKKTPAPAAGDVKETTPGLAKADSTHHTETHGAQRAKSLPAERVAKVRFGIMAYARNGGSENPFQPREDEIIAQFAHSETPGQVIEILNAMLAENELELCSKPGEPRVFHWKYHPPSPTSAAAPDAPKKKALEWWKTPAGWVRMGNQQALSMKEDEAFEDFQIRVAARLPFGRHLDVLSVGQVRAVEAAIPKDPAAKKDAA